MYFPDLSQYRHDMPFPDGQPVPDVLAVGWLQKGMKFPVGETPELALRRIEYLIVRAPVARMRGWHSCDLCETAPDRPFLINTEFGNATLGMSQIWVPSSRSGYYASPTLIHHYVTSHGYLPPHGYLSALERFDPSMPWDAQAEYDRRIARLYGE